MVETAKSKEELANEVRTLREQLTQLSQGGNGKDHTIQMQTAAEIAQIASSLLTLGDLLPRAVELIRERFDLYYVGIFLVDDDGAWALLKAGTGEEGRHMLAEGHRLQVGVGSMVGASIATAEPHVSQRSHHAAASATMRYDNPLLPETRSEMALPLVSRGRVLGAMTVQSQNEGAFDRDDIAVLKTMAGQLANAIQNAQLYERTERTARENEALYRVSASIGEAETIEDVVHATADVAALMQMDNVSLRVFTRWDETGTPLVMDMYGTSRRPGEDEDAYEADLPSHPPLFEWAFAEPGRVFVCADLNSPNGRGGDQEIPEALRARLRRRGHRSLVMAPLMVRNRRQGVLSLCGARPLAPTAQQFAHVVSRTLMDQVASALERHFLIAELERRASHLATASEVSRAASAYLEQDRLLSEGVDLIRQRFDLYFVGIFLLDDSDQWAILRAATGAPGKRMLRDGFRYRVNESSRIGSCILRRTPLIVRDGGDPGQGFARDYLPDAQAEVVLPLISRGNAIGAMLLQSAETGAISRDDTTILSTLADQMANAIANAQLYEASQDNLEELQRLQQRYALDMWDEHAENEEVLGYTYDLNEISPLMSLDELEFPTGLGPDEGGFGDGVVRRGVEGGDGAALMQALEIRGEQIGLMRFEQPAAAVDWTEEEAAILQAVREQLELALENRLLIDRSQRALREAQQREAELGFLQEISALLNATNDVAASRQALMDRLQEFVAINHLVLVGYDRDEDELQLLAGIGEGFALYAEGEQGQRLQRSGCAWVIDHEEALSQDDLRRAMRFPEDDALAAQGVLSRLLLPLRLGYRTLGVLELGSHQVNAFARSGLMPILQQVAAQIASAMERGNLLSVAQASAEESRRLYEATSDLAEATDAQAVLEAIARHVFPAMPAEAQIGVYIADPETGTEQDWVEIVATLATGQDAPMVVVGTRTRVVEMASLSLLARDQIFISQDIRSDDRLTPETRAHYLEQGVQALVVTRLSTGVGASDRIGVLQVLFHAPHEMSMQNLRLYHTVSDQAAVVLSNRQLFQESQARIERQAVAVELANLTTSLSEREALLQGSVDFLQDRFGLYFAGIFLMDDQGQWAVLHAGTGTLGQRLLTMGHRARIGNETMVGRCVQQRQRILALDIDRGAAEGENPMLPDTRSAVVFPLVSRGQINGALALQSTRRFAFTEDDIAALELMVNQLANVIESTNLYERSQSSLAETRMLYRIAQQITDARDAEAVLRAAVEGIAQRSEPDWVVAGLLEPQDDPTDLRVAISWSRSGVSLPINCYPLDRIRRWYDVLRTDERFVTPDITQDPMVEDYMRRVYGELGLRATAAFQLKVRGAQYGTIMVHSENSREFSTAELSFYENVARQAFVALENISLVDATREQAERRDILNQVLQTASSSLEEPTILRDVGEVIADRLNMPVVMWQWDTIAAHPISVHDAGGRRLLGANEKPRFSTEELSRIYEVIETGEPTHVIFGNLTGELGAGLAAPLVEGYAVPLAARDIVYGVLLLGRQAGHEPITDLEREFIRTAGANVSVALETASLYRDAQETAEKLREVDELKNQFMANMSHELRTPLNSIIGFSRVMLKGIDGPLTEMQQTDLSAIYDSGRHLLDLINDILDISKINAGKMEAVFEPVDLRAMIQSVLSTALGFVKDKAVELRSDVPENLPNVVADARRIRQVMTNLIGNAGKFTEKGYIKISATYDDYQVIVSVEDTGIGIPPDRLHAVFEQFEQVDSSSTRRYGGTGLGVPLSREFVRMHGGDMWIQETKVGEGTTFSFSLPIGGPDTVREEVVETDDDPVGKVILTVDDDEGVVMLFRRYLEKEGFRVFGLTSSDRVVEEAKRLKPYAITLDVIMPGRDGWSTIQELKSDPETRDIPVLICSILSEKDKGLSMGVADYLTKPISEHQLLRALNRIDQSDGGGYVLVVDDNPDDRKLLRRILMNARYEVVEAAGGADAIDRIHDHPPMLVVLDLMMPDVDGFAVLEHMKGSKATRQIPVVVVTAKALSDEERARLQRRVESLLQKGIFDQQQLLNDVKGALTRLSERGQDRRA